MFSSFSIFPNQSFQSSKQLISYILNYKERVRPLISDSLLGFRIPVWKLVLGAFWFFPGSWRQVVGHHPCRFWVWGFPARVLFLLISPLGRWVSIPSPTKDYCISLTQHSLVEKGQAVKSAKPGLALWFVCFLASGLGGTTYFLRVSVSSSADWSYWDSHFRAVGRMEGSNYIKFLAFSSSWHSLTVHQNHNYLQSFCYSYTMHINVYIHI